ncbi:hypothetical protein MKZ38_005242 [Zalerion maritima]|uniref:Pseudouridine synthase RsuA/RluA-like domain-containing protein n=1 Tax=Zalerion maritima TaxID=339359 RepID=A0AAD5RKK2_9PEZI|nr:hypothetical protein MKZ38_005242 [Zalerion maritima]
MASSAVRSSSPGATTGSDLPHGTSPGSRTPQLQSQAAATTPSALNSAGGSKPQDLDEHLGQLDLGELIGPAPIDNTPKPKPKRAHRTAHGKKSGKKARPSPPVISPPCGDIWPRPYDIAGGLRTVAPYHFTYQTYCKQRWQGRSLIEIYEAEFRDRPLDYYRNAIETGKITVNGHRVAPAYVMIDHDLVVHTIHRHEPPVTADPIGIIHEDDEMIVINKPSGVPVHPAGRYNYNCVLEIMKSERHQDFIGYPCNRLDRLTSGIMFVGKTSVGAQKMSDQILARTVRKEYLARVVGKFPDGEVVCDQPILSISPKLGLNRVRASGKPARTVFKRLAYYPPRQRPGSGEAPEETAENDVDDTAQPWLRKEGYSIVRCLPVTGRTHQLRVHLQHLGHPIQNDPIYANQKVWGFDLGFNDADASKNSDDDIITRLDRMGKEDVADAVAYHDEMVDKFYKQKAEKLSGQLCKVCDTPLYTEPGLHELSLYLHSLRYEDADDAWSYVSPLPKWALPPEGIEGPTQVGGIESLVQASDETDMPEGVES